MPTMHARHLAGTALLLLLALLVAATPGFAQAPPRLDDARIAHIVVTANAIDAELAELARDRARDDRVKQFAATMIADHTSVNELATALAGRLGVTPTDNDVSRGLRVQADSIARHLGTLRGTAFDRAYMEREVAYHQAVLEALDGALIPNASNGELKQLLGQARGAVAAHLEHARSLLAALEGSK